MAALRGVSWTALSVLSFALIHLVIGKCLYDSQCQNGGSCDFQVCVCAEGYKGSSCAEPVCVPSCENGGQCVAPGRCDCGSQYNGPSCQNRDSSGGSLGYSVRYIPGALFGGGLLLCTCISILLFWFRIRRGQQRPGRGRSSTTRRRRRRSGRVQTSQSQRRTSTSAASGRRVIVAPQPSPLANPNAPPPYAPSAGPLSSDPPPYTAQLTADSLQPLPQGLQLPLHDSYADEPPAYLPPPAYDPE